MARSIERLSAKSVATKKAPGYYGDGGGLYLQVSASGSKSWIFRFTLGKAREMGLGSANTFGLAQARERARAARQLLADGIDPIEEKRATVAARNKAAATLITFEAAATAYIKSHRAGWRSSKHAAQWAATLETYAFPIIGRLAVSDLDTALVTRVLEPIWTTKPETASRLRGRVEAIIGWSTVRGFRSGENPARWRGHLDNLLPARDKVRKVVHHAALPYKEIGNFMAALRKQPGIAARALEFAVLTAARTGEVIGATWGEIDMESAVWTIPAARMKVGREHKIPLTDQALSVLHQVVAARSGDYVFPGAKETAPLSNMSMAMLLRRMGYAETVHGMRAAFKTWASEATSHPREVIELALAHRLGDKAEQAYDRGDLINKRKRLMNDWARYCAMVSSDAKVVKLNTARA